jgi:hypothetical protein
VQKCEEINYDEIIEGRESKDSTGKGKISQEDF